MHLMIDINGQQQHYSFPKKNSVSIGRGTSCDIQLNTDGISRHHADILNKNGDFFITDRGSTNGTFINEDRLTVNELTSFNTFFPARLGFYVMVHLLDEVPADIAVMGVANTNTDSLASLSSTQSHQGIKKPKIPINAAGDKTHTGIIQVKTTDFKVLIGLFLTIAILIYMNIEHFAEYFSFNDEPSVANIAPKLEVKAPLVKTEVIDPVKAEQDLLQTANEVLMKDRCFVEAEKKLCDLLVSFRSRNHTEGVYISLGKLFFIVDLNEVKKFYDEAFKNYATNDLNRLLLLLKRSRTGVNIEELKQRGDYILGEKSLLYDTNKLYLFLDFFRPEFVAQVMSSSEVTEMYLVAHELIQGEYKAQKVVKLGKVDLQRINIAEAHFALRVAIRSHYYDLLDQVFKGINLK